ncbi:RNA polymerase sigma factor SigJ [Kiloniella antarctica]|uniref:RNA polymerase sigma factor SigJ n=1 Tax=Kiloniella antarctica TaxID=1550907 RepID=A0ABW5BFK3_9PROT
MMEQDHISSFEKASPTLTGLAYRILGSFAEAEDAVQDTFLKWSQADKDKILNPKSWLMTVCTRRSLDLLKASHKSRVAYVGNWLPEPVGDDFKESPEDQTELASSVTTAFLLLLERLTPKERAAYLLREIFDYSYADLSGVLEASETTCRKLVSRAKKNVEASKVRQETPPDRQEELLKVFQAALLSGSPDELGTLLSEDIQLVADSGGKVIAVQDILQGKAGVLDFTLQTLGPVWREYEQIVTRLNGQLGLVLLQQGKVTAAVTFDYDDTNQLCNVYIMRNPDKLVRIEQSLRIVQ